MSGNGALVAVGEAKSALSRGISSQTTGTHTHTIGVIVPPPDIRAIADKTATFVARNGPEFEKRILANEANNVKFNFLKSGDPYHAYYVHKVNEVKGGEGAPASGAPSTNDARLPHPASAVPTAAPTLVPPTGNKAQVIPPTKPLETPEEEHYTVHVPEGMTLLDLDVMKLTAQFVARNGKSFLTNLTSREHSNPQFNFLRPTHSLFSFFTRLCDAYSRVLLPPKGTVAALKIDATDRSAPLQRALNRLEFNKIKEKEAKDAADAEEAERMAMLSIDWHDFVVVETIDFDQNEELGLPAPVTKKDILQMARASAFEVQMQEPMKEGEGQGQEQRMMDAEEQALVNQGIAAATTQHPVVSTKNIADMDVSDEEEEAKPIKVVKNYKRQDPRAIAGSGHDPTKYVVSPITGELVLIADMAEHMRVSLIDPKWKQQKDIMLSKIKETTKASDEEISRNLSLLAKTRPDVFGTSDRQAMSSALEQQIHDERNAAAEQDTAKRQRTMG